MKRKKMMMMKMRTKMLTMRKSMIVRRMKSLNQLKSPGYSLASAPRSFELPKHVATADSPRPCGFRSRHAPAKRLSWIRQAASERQADPPRGRHPKVRPRRRRDARRAPGGRHPKVRPRPRWARQAAGRTTAGLATEGRSGQNSTERPRPPGPGGPGSRVTGVNDRARGGSKG